MRWSALSHQSPLSISVFLVLSALWPALAFAGTKMEGPPFPRLANLYLQGAVAPQDIPRLARWDLLVLGSQWTESQLQQLRALNPDIKLYFYVCPYCTGNPPPASDTWKLGNYNYAQQNDLWWRNWNRTIASDWPGVGLLNITDRAPAGPQGTYRDFIVSRVYSLVYSRPSLDGVFYDNFWSSIAWEQGGLIQVDSDCSPTHNPAGCDGVMDSKATVDSLWNRALRNIARRTRQNFNVLEGLRPNRPLSILGNRASDYFADLNGSLLEDFPAGTTVLDPGNAYDYDWNQEMFGLHGGYLTAPFRTTPYKVQIINANGEFSAPDGTPDFERHKRFTLASALMGDGYYSFDAVNSGHGSIWWEPEYDNGGQAKGYLGYPKGPMYRFATPWGPELLTNGGFQLGTTAWQTLRVNATAVVANDAGSFHSAPFSCRINTQNLAKGGSFKLYQSVPIYAGKGYSLSFWAKADFPQEVIVDLYSESCPDNRCLSDRHLRLTQTWTRYDISFVASGTAFAGLNIFVMTPGTVWFDDFSLREGDTSVYRRDFDRGTVLLNYTTTTQSVALGGTYYRLKVPGSPVWDGGTVTTELVPPSDGRILLRNPQATPTGPAPLVPSRLLQNDPNPFNPQTMIRFVLGQDEHVQLEVFDVAGRLVKTLLNRMLPAGERGVRWDGTDRFGRKMESGIYFYRISTPSLMDTKKMTLLK